MTKHKAQQSRVPRSVRRGSVHVCVCGPPSIYIGGYLLFSHLTSGKSASCLCTHSTYFEHGNDDIEVKLLGRPPRSPRTPRARAVRPRRPAHHHRRRAVPCHHLSAYPPARYTGYHSVYTVEGGHRAVVWNRWSGLTDKVEGEGLKFRVSTPNTRIRQSRRVEKSTLPMCQYQAGRGRGWKVGWTADLTKT